MGVINRMSPDQGDLEIKWNRNIDAEVDHAREAFDSARKQGFIAYKIGRSGKKTVITEFDSKLERIVMTPARIRG